MSIEHQQQVVEQPLDQRVIADYADSEMPAMQSFWIRVWAQAAELDPLADRYDAAIRAHNPNHKHGILETSTKQIWITSKKHPTKNVRGGRVFCVGPALAAKLMVNETHQLSTPEEIQGWHTEQEQRVKEAQALALSKQPPPAQITVNLPPELVNRQPREAKSNSGS